MRDIQGTSAKIDKIIKKNNNKIGKLWRKAGRIDSLTDEFILICMEANMLEDMNFKIKDFKGFPIQIIEKEKGFWRYIIGGTLFGLGWALVGSCPGPIFILLGTGTYAIAVVLIGALLGTYIYGLLKDKLPH